MSAERLTADSFKETGVQSSEPEASDKSSYGNKSPTTPERKKHTGDRSSIPQTPPNQHYSRFNQQNTPTDHGDNYLPPQTPSSSLNYQAQSKHKLSNVPQTPSAGLPGSSNNETSPLKSPEPHIQEEEDDKPPIRQISNALKTRLSYAFVKVQKGWANQSLDELEKNLSQNDEASFKPEIQSKTASTPKISPSKIIKPIKSPQRNLKVEPPIFHRRKFSNEDEEEPIAQFQKMEDDDGSANIAFLQAISKTRSPKRRQNNFHQPLRLDPTATLVNDNPEADAIQTLMSLSSPQSFKHNTDLSPSRPLPRQRLSFGEKLSPKLNDETDIETDVATDDDKKVEVRTRKKKVKSSVETLDDATASESE